MNSNIVTMRKIFIGCFVLISFIGCQINNEEGHLIFFSANNEKGFNYPFFLFIPDSISSDSKNVLIVEPNNSGFASDEFGKHVEKAERIASKEYYGGNYVARKLNYPLLVPVFPRPKKEWKIYTHALDRDVMLQKNNQLERIDLQLIAMIKHAIDTLSNLGFSMHNQIFMTGFSASGTFANRFTLMHPNKVLATAAGGVNGLLMLPLKEISGKELNYPLGVNDFKILFNSEFNSTAFSEIPQFLFMGELDENDAVPYKDGYSVEERELVFELLGKEMLPARWEYCKRVYSEKVVNAHIKTYAKTGHEQPDKIKKDIVNFFRSVYTDLK